MSPPTCAPMVGAPPASPEIVVLDIERLRSSDAAADDGIDLLLDKAFDHHGLGLLCITGDEAFQAEVRRIREELLPLTVALERLSEEELEEIRERPGTRNVNGYSRGADGHRSGFYFHPATDTPGDTLPEGVAPEPTFYSPNRWPDRSLPALRTEARRAAPFLVSVGAELAAALDRRLARLPEVGDGYRKGMLRDLVGEAATCNHKCRLICYHEYESQEQRAKHKGMWAPPHKDTGLFTVLVPSIFLTDEGARLPSCPDQEVGLYVRDRQGAISQVRTLAGIGECLLFQLGEAMQVVSGGAYHATEHCVRGPPAARRGYLRSTLAVFFQPHGHEDLELPGGISFEHVAERAHDGMFRMFLLHQPKDARGINFLNFCHRHGF